MLDPRRRRMIAVLEVNQEILPDKAVSPQGFNAPRARITQHIDCDEMGIGTRVFNSVNKWGDIRTTLLCRQMPSF